jgi:2-hydroxychromene-2-carboxylate isomerase
MKYSYMVWRRQARKRGLTILLARARSGILHWPRLECHGRSASTPDFFRNYHDRVFEKFWRRELYIENPEVIESTLAASGANPSVFKCYLSVFKCYLSGRGRAEHDEICHEADAAGVFGVPTLVIDGELFWGREHLADIRAMLANPSATHNDA